MRWLHFITNKAGKFTLGVPQVLALAGVGALAVYTATQFDEPAKKPQQVRDLSAITHQSERAGMRRDASGNLTSVNVGDRLNQLATAQERARMQGGSNDFGLSAADNVGGAVDGAFGRAAAATSDTEGLGMGGNKVGGFIGEGTSSGARSGTAMDGSVLKAAAQSAANGNTLQSASMARASGSGLSASYGAGSSSSGVGSPFSGNSGLGGSASGLPSGEGSHRLSGSMPTGSVGLIASAKGKSSFGRGNDKGGFGAGRRQGFGGDDLKTIAKRSAAVAANSDRAANEGSSAFLGAGQESGGLLSEAGLSDSEGPSLAKFDQTEYSRTRALKKWGDGVSADETRREKAMNKIWMWMGIMFGATLIACPLIARAKEAGGWWWLGVAGAIIALGALFLQLRHFTMQFVEVWGKNSLTLLAGIITGLCVGAVGLSIAFSAQVKKWTTGLLEKALKSAWTYVGAPMATTAVTHEIGKINDDAMGHNKK